MDMLAGLNPRNSKRGGAGCARISRWARNPAVAELTRAEPPRGPNKSGPLAEIRCSCRSGQGGRQVAGAGAQWRRAPWKNGSRSYRPALAQPPVCSDSCMGPEPGQISGPVPGIRLASNPSRPPAAMRATTSRRAASSMTARCASRRRSGVTSRRGCLPPRLRTAIAALPDG